MLINAGDPRQWTYLRNLPKKKKKKKTPRDEPKGGKMGLGGGGGIYFSNTRWLCVFQNFRIKEPSVPGI